MRRFSLIGIILATSFLSSVSSASSLEDCLLEKLDGVTSDIAAKAIIDACERKFSDTGRVSSPDQKDGDLASLTDQIVLTLHKSLFASEAPVYKIPVPRGNWVKVGDSVTHREQPPIYQEIWISYEGSKLHHIMFVTYNKSGNEYGWKKSRQCARKNLHYIVPIENRDGGEQNCYGVNHYRISGGSDQLEVVQEAKEFARENGIAFPSTVVTHFHRLANKHLLDFWIGYNPELEGFPAPTDASWDSNDWHQDRIIGDPDRQKYISKIKELGDSTHKIIEPQFKF